MTVVRPNSIAGINSITVQTGQALNIHDASGNLIRNITSSSGVSTFSSLHIGSGTTTNTHGISVGTGCSIISRTVNDLEFYTNNSQKVVIKSGGGVGINESSPTGKLTVTQDPQGFPSDSNQDKATVLIKHGTSGSNRRWIGIGASLTGAWIQSSSPGGSGLSAPLVLNPSGGHVGISSASPTATRFSGTVSGLLNVAGTKPCVYINETDSKDSSGTDRALYWGLSGGTAYGGSNADFVLGTGDTGTTERLRIRTDGRVAIASSLAVTGVCTAAAFVPTEGHLGNRNIIINGDMRVAQRGTSDASADFITTVDRFGMAVNLTEEHVTRAQETLSSSDTGPYEKGFRRAWKLTNGNQTGGADAGGYVIPQYHVEAQDIATSGWNYKSASSYITLSFWVKSSVSQTFYGFFRTIDGTGQAYSFSYTASSTWKYVTVKIPGNSNIDINHDEGSGLALYLPTFMGTDRTNSGNVEETWAAYSSSNRTKDHTTTWYTTNDATWHLTGVQLEVGSVATPFEHRSYADELRRCQRYFYKTYRQGIDPGTDDATDICSWRNQMSAGRTDMTLNIPFAVPMRATPTITSYSKNGNSNKYLETGIDYSGGNEGTFAGTVYAGRKYLNQLSSGNTVDSGSYAHFHFTAAAEI